MKKTTSYIFACALALLDNGLYASNIYNNQVNFYNNQVNFYQNNEVNASIEIAKSIQNSYKEGIEGYYTISGLLVSTLQDLSKELNNANYDSVIKHTQTSGTYLQIIFSTAQTYNDNTVIQKVKNIARLLEKAIYNYFYYSVFKKWVDVRNIELSNIDTQLNTKNVSKQERNSAIFGYELGILKEYMCEYTNEYDSNKLRNCKLTAMKACITSLSDTIRQFTDKYIGQTLINSASQLNDVISDSNNQYSDSNNKYDELNRINKIYQIKDQLTRVCKAYINYSILNDITNIK